MTKVSPVQVSVMLSPESILQLEKIKEYLCTSVASQAIRFCIREIYERIKSETVNSPETES